MHTKTMKYNRTYPTELQHKAVFLNISFQFVNMYVKTNDLKTTSIGNEQKLHKKMQI